MTRRDPRVQEMGQTLHALVDELADLAKSVDRLSAQLLREWSRCRRMHKRLLEIERKAIVRSRRR